MYEIVCKANGFVYIGQTKNLYRRIGEQIRALRKDNSRNKRMQLDYNKYGEDVFCYTVELCDMQNLDRREAERIEQARQSGACYNVFSGGRTGCKANNEFRERCSEIHKGRKVSEETRRKNAESARRQWQNEDYRNIMVESVNRQWADQDYRNAMVKLHTGNCRNCHHIFSDDEIKDIRKRADSGESCSKIADSYHVTYCTIKNIANRKSYKHIA